MPRFNGCFHPWHECMVQQNCVPSLLILHDAISGNEFAFVWQLPWRHAWEFHYHTLAMLTHFHVLAIFGNADICPPMQPFLAIFIPAAKHLQGFAQAKSLGPTAAMEVTIQTSVAIKVGDEKAISIPPTFLVEHDGRSFLKFRPTGHQIVQLVCGCDMPKNSSLANSISLDQLLKKRKPRMAETQLWPRCFPGGWPEAREKEEANHQPRADHHRCQWPSSWMPHAGSKAN